MSIEDEVFDRKKLNIDKLLKFGFKRDGENYKYSQTFLHNSFRADICIDPSGRVSGKVFDLEINDEYASFRIKDIDGQFVNSVRAEYKAILEDIAEECFDHEMFSFAQTNRIVEMLEEKYVVYPEFLWEKYPNYAVFRYPNDKKWFATILDVDRSKLTQNDTGKVEIMCLKLDRYVPESLTRKGVYPAYHFNKKNWVTIFLDDTISDEEIMSLVDLSLGLRDKNSQWLIPANPAYYDVIAAFDQSDTIIWKKTKSMKVGDTVYLYLTEPYSAILFKCEIVEENVQIEHGLKGREDLSFMKIRLQKRYRGVEFTFSKLRLHGINAIRGARRVPKELAELL